MTLEDAQYIHEVCWYDESSELTRDSWEGFKMYVEMMEAEQKDSDVSTDEDPVDMYDWHENYKNRRLGKEIILQRLQ